MDKTLKLLLDSGDVTPLQLQASLEEHVRTGQDVLKILVEKGFVSDSKVKGVLELHALNDIDIKQMQISPDVLRMLPLHVINNNKVFPIHFENNKFIIAMVNPKDLITTDTISLFLGKTISIQRLKISEDDYFLLLNKYGHFLDNKKDKDLETNYEALNDHHSELKEGETSSVEKAVKRLFENALRKRASQITLEPGSDAVKIRLKIDDTFYEEARIPKKAYQNFLNHIKEMSSSLDLEEKSMHYSGHFKFPYLEDKEINFVVNGIKTVTGERLIIRPGYPIPDLRKLFYCDEIYDFVDKAISKNKGIVLVVGTAGSGKSTTLYSLLQHKISNRNQLMTIEDPIKYIFGNYVAQVHLKQDRIGSLPEFINEVSRHNPDVLMLQEIKDEEWGSLLEELALSGMLIFSGIKAYNVISVLKRLKRMRFPNFSSIQTLIHQKLLKMLCPYCKVKYTPSSDELHKVGLTFDKISVAYDSDPSGCNKCYGGYKGLIGSFEVIPVTREMIKILNQESFIVEDFVEELNRSAIMSFKEYGFRLLKDGIISFEEFNKLL